MSGIVKMPFSVRILLASGVVGPLAPSTRRRVLMCPAFSRVIWFSMAAGINMSHSVSSNSLVVMFLDPS